MNTSAPFDLETARELLSACAASYTPAPGPEEQCLDTDLAHVRMRQFPASAPGDSPCLVLAFRGTHSLRDWLTDFEFLRREAGPGEKLHYGFASAWLGLQGPLTRCLDPGPPFTSHPPLLITGHSLGGALAMLAAQGLYREGYTIAGVYTFGAPRVGNAVWADTYDLWLKRCTWRLVDELDLVPRVPLLGYRHAGHRVQLGEHGLFVDPPWWRTLVQDAAGLYQAWKAKRIAQLTDHPVATYQRRLAALNAGDVFQMQKAETLETKAETLKR